jgi:hypothetical protein
MTLLSCDFAGAGAVPWQQQPPAQQAAGAVAAIQKALGSAAAELLVARLAAAAAVDPAAEAAAPHSELTMQQVPLLCGFHAGFPPPESHAVMAADGPPAQFENRPTSSHELQSRNAYSHQRCYDSQQP